MTDGMPGTRCWIDGGPLPASIQFVRWDVWLVHRLAPLPQETVEACGALAPWRWRPWTKWRWNGLTAYIATLCAEHAMPLRKPEDGAAISRASLKWRASAARASGTKRRKPLLTLRKPGFGHRTFTPGRLNRSQRAGLPPLAMLGADRAVLVQGQVAVPPADQLPAEDLGHGASPVLSGETPLGDGSDNLPNRLSGDDGKAREGKMQSRRRERGHRAPRLPESQGG